jgi:hypothetical protein
MGTTKTRMVNLAAPVMRPVRGLIGSPSRANLGIGRRGFSLPRDLTRSGLAVSGRSTRIASLEIRSGFVNGLSMRVRLGHGLRGVKDMQKLATP